MVLIPTSTSVLPRSAITLRFPPSSDEEENYQLLELPSEILKQVEGKSEPLSITIKGRPSDDAVLCTPNKTYQLRTVGISNSLLICLPPNSSHLFNSSNTQRKERKESQLEIRDVSHEILEISPQAPNLERIRILLRSSAWKGLGYPLPSTSGKKRKRNDEEGTAGKEVKMYSRKQLESVIQASDAELEMGLKERNVIEIADRLIMLPPKILSPVLAIIFNLLTIHTTTPTSLISDGIAETPARPIISALKDDHDIPGELASGIMKLFSATSKRKAGKDEGGIKEDAISVEWVADTREMVKQVGLGSLEGVTEKKSLDRFEEDWKAAVGSDWEELVDIKLLEGNYLLSDPPISSVSSPSPLISYFPYHLLPLNPAIRFTDLFLTRSRWRPDDMLPFLKGLYRDEDTKERDKIIAKFIRIVKEKEGVWWYPRRGS